MKQKTVHYIRRYYPGLMVSNNSAEEVSSRDPHQIQPKRNMYGFMFFDKVEVTTEANGESVVTLSKQMNESPTYYHGGRVLSQSDVAKMGSRYNILLSNMQCNEWDRVIQIRAGSCFPLRDGDVVLDV